MESSKLQRIKRNFKIKMNQKLLYFFLQITSKLFSRDLILIKVLLYWFSTTHKGQKSPSSLSSGYAIVSWYLLFFLMTQFEYCKIKSTLQIFFAQQKCVFCLNFWQIMLILSARVCQTRFFPRVCNKRPPNSRKALKKRPGLWSVDLHLMKAVRLCN